MQSKVKNIEAYLKEIPLERQEVFTKLRATIQENIPKGFVEQMSYGMIGFVVPQTTYPDGYHCNPKLPLPFVNIASQKNFIALYHMGIYGNPKLLEWFVAEYPKHNKQKLDMGKGCIRFKKMDQIPFELIGELMQKITVEGWIYYYESHFKKSN